MGAPVQGRGNRRGNFGRPFPKIRPPPPLRPPMNGGFGFEPMMRPPMRFRPPMRPPMMPPPHPRWMRPPPPPPPPRMMGPRMRPPMMRPPPPPMPMAFRPRNIQKGRIMKRGAQRRGPEIDLSKPWVTEALRHEFKRKEELLRTAKGTENKDDWAVYRGQREKCNQMYHAAQMEHLGQQEVRITQLLPESNYARVNTAPIDYTADVKL